MTRIKRWAARIEAQLDSWGTPGWIGATILGFILFPPLGLVILGYAIWSKKMTCNSRRKNRLFSRQETGNTAFDEYRRETLRRLEEERDAFTDFLGRLREAKDRSEFDQFQAERNSQSAA